MSRHSSTNVNELVKANQELRTKVQDLQDKLARSENAIKTAITAASEGYHHGGSNLSVTTLPSTILAVAQEISHISPTRNRGHEAITSPLSSSNVERIDRLVISNRELRQELSSKDEKIGRYMQEVTGLHKQLSAHESKIVSLLNDLDNAHNAIREAVANSDALCRQPAQWEIERSRLVAAQDSERAHMIDLLNRERSEQKSLQANREEYMERALATQRAELLESSSSHVQRLERLQQDALQILQQERIDIVQNMQKEHTQDIERLKKEHETAECALTSSHGQQLQKLQSEKRALETANHDLKNRLQMSEEQSCKRIRQLEADLKACQGQLLAQSALTRVQLDVCSGERTEQMALDLFRIPVEVQRQPRMPSRDSYCYFPLELGGADYCARILSAIDRCIRPAITRKLLELALAGTRSAHMQSLPTSPAKEVWELRVEGAECRDDLPMVQNPAEKVPPSPPQTSVISMQALLSAQVKRNLETSHRPRPMSMDAFLALSPVPKVSVQAPPQNTSVKVSDWADRSCLSRLPSSPLDLVALYLQQCPSEEMHAALSVLRQLEHATQFPEVACLNAAKKLSVHFADTAAKDGEQSNSDVAQDIFALPEIAQLHEVCAQADMHARFTATRLAALGWRDADVPGDVVSPSVVHTMHVLLDTVRFVGITSDANHMARLCAPLVKLRDFLRQPGLASYLRYLCRLRQWQCKFLADEGSLALLKSVTTLLDASVCDTCGDNPALLALLQHVHDDELFALSQNAPRVRHEPISGSALLRFMGLISCIASDTLEAVASLLKRAAEERQDHALTQLRTLRTSLQELVNLTVDVETRAAYVRAAGFIHSALLRSPSHILSRSTLGEAASVGCYSARDDTNSTPSAVGDSNRGWYCLSELGSLNAGILPRLTPLLPHVPSRDSEVLRITPALLWEVPCACEGVGFDSADRMSLASHVLRCQTPNLLRLAYNTLSDMNVRIPSSTLRLMLAQRKRDRSPDLDPHDCTNAVVPASWVADFAASEKALPGPLALRRAYGVSIFTLMDCHMYSRAEVLHACAFSVYDIGQQHSYHKSLAMDPKTHTIMRGRHEAVPAAEFIQELCTAPTTSLRSSPDRTAAKMSLAAYDDHYSPFIVQELKAAGLSAMDARKVLDASPKTLQRGGYDDFSIVTRCGFSLADLLGSGAARVNLYPYIQRLVLTELYNATSSGAPVSAVRLDESLHQKHGWRRDFNWCSSKVLGDWYGITTDAQRNVVKIDLRCNRLSGALPSCLRLLQNLESFDVHDNELTGPLGTWMAELTALRLLSIHTNYLDQNSDSQQALAIIGKALPNCLIRA